LHITRVCNEREITVKIQDIVFFIVLIGLVIVRKEKLFILFGLLSIALSMPLFAQWVFFTAERLTWYGVAFLLVGTILIGLNKKEII